MGKWILKSSDNPFSRSRANGNLMQSHKILESFARSSIFSQACLLQFAFCFCKPIFYAFCLHVILSFIFVCEAGPLFCSSFKTIVLLEDGTTPILALSLRQQGWWWWLGVDHWLQVPAWMKETDQDEDGRLTYKEFKDSVIDAERSEKERTWSFVFCDLALINTQQEGFTIYSVFRHTKFSGVSSLLSLARFVSFAFAHSWATWTASRNWSRVSVRVNLLSAALNPSIQILSWKKDKESY